MQINEQKQLQESVQQRTAQQQDRRERRRERRTQPKGWQQDAQPQLDASAQQQLLNALIADASSLEERSLRERHLLQLHQRRQELQSCLGGGTGTLQPLPEVLSQQHALGQTAAQSSEALQRQLPQWPAVGSLMMGGGMAGNLPLQGSQVMAPNAFSADDVGCNSNLLDPSQSVMPPPGYSRMVPYMMLPVEAFGLSPDAAASPMQGIPMGWMGGNGEVYSD